MIHSILIRLITLISKTKKMTLNSLYMLNRYVCSMVFALFVLTAPQSVFAQVEYETLDWTDLLPPMDLAALESLSLIHI